MKLVDGDWIIALETDEKDELQEAIDRAIPLLKEKRDSFPDQDDDEPAMYNRALIALRAFEKLING